MDGLTNISLANINLKMPLEAGFASWTTYFSGKISLKIDKVLMHSTFHLLRKSLPLKIGEMPRSTASDAGPFPSPAVSGTKHPPSRGAPSSENSEKNAMKDYSSVQQFITFLSYELYALNK